jgi:hypothetical protein
MVTTAPYLWKKNINSSWQEGTGVGGNNSSLSQCDPARRAFLCYRNITE